MRSTLHLALLPVDIAGILGSNLYLLDDRAAQRTQVS